MKKWISVLFVLFLSSVTLANPVVVPDPVSIFAYVMVVGSAILIEACLVTLVLLFFNLSIKPLFFGLYLGNLVIYLVLFLPLLKNDAALWIAEIAVVGADGILIKALSSYEIFQGEDFKRLKWSVAFLIAAAGNLVSYYVGSVMTA